jgi:hypothetical protein
LVGQLFNACESIKVNFGQLQLRSSCVPPVGVGGNSSRH